MNQTNGSLRGEVAKTILALVGVAGIVAVGAVAPGLLQLVPRSMRSRYPRKQFQRTIHRLDKNGFVVLRQTATGWKISLTKRGQLELTAYKLGQRMIQKPKEWDKKWRLLIFDVPEKKKIVRDMIRSFLISVGFVRLQDSIWAYPYECKDVLELLQAKYGAHHEALYVRAEEIGHDRWLRRQFGLS